MPDPRYPYVVGAVKIAYEDRDIAHAVITPDDDRDYFNVSAAEMRQTRPIMTVVGGKVVHDTGALA